MVPFAHGNDGGGSLRIPASCCGLVGLKPQRGRVSHAPELGEQFLVQDGVLTRTVGETAALLDVLAGTEHGDASWAPPPPEPFAAAAAREPGRLRIAMTWSPSLGDVAVDPDCIRAVTETGLLLEGLGHEVVPADPPWGGEGLLDLFGALFGPAVSSQIAAAGMLAGREPAEEDMEPLSWWVWRRARALDAVSANLAAVRMQTLARAVVTWAQPYDAILSPTLAEAPVPQGTIDPFGPEPALTFARGAEIHAVHGDLQRHRIPRDLAAAGGPSGRPPARRPARRTARRGGPAARARCTAGGRPAVVRQARTIPGSQRDWSREPPMAYVIAEPCIGTKDNSCVEVCPVDCIHPTPDEPDYDKVEQLYIDPEECIDCDACVEACPVDACFAEDQLPSEWAGFSQINQEYFTSR